LAFAVPALPFIVTDGSFAVCPTLASRRSRGPAGRPTARSPNRRAASSPSLRVQRSRWVAGSPCPSRDRCFLPLLGFVSVRPSSVSARGRPLQERCRSTDPSGRGCHTTTSCSVPVVSHHLDGFLRPRVPRMFQRGSGPGVRWVSPDPVVHLALRPDSGREPVPRQRCRTLRRLPLAGSRTASLRPLPSCRSSRRGPRSTRDGCRVSRPRSRTPRRAPAASTPLTLRAAPPAEARVVTRQSTPGSCSTVESVPPSAVSDGRRSILPWALFPSEAPQLLPLVPTVSRGPDPAAGSRSMTRRSPARRRRLSGGSVRDRLRSLPPWGSRRQRAARIWGPGSSRGVA
jgi:hypothetical protein